MFGISWAKVGNFDIIMREFEMFGISMANLDMFGISLVKVFFLA
jgi:hypothetical protein